MDVTAGKVYTYLFLLDSLYPIYLFHLTLSFKSSSTVYMNDNGKTNINGGGGVTRVCYVSYVTVGEGSSLVLRSVKEERGGSGRRQNWRCVTSEC